MKNQHITNYQNFNFASHEKWQEYAKNIDKSISDKRLEYIKRRWYKSNIDRNFDPDFDKISFEEFQQKQREKEKTSYKDASFIKRCLYDSENGLKLMFMTSTVFFHSMALFLGYIMSFLALIRQLRMPKLNVEFLKTLLKNEFLHNIVYLYIFSFYKEWQHIIMFSPIMVHSWVGICDYAYLRQGKIYESMIYQQNISIGMKRQVDITRANKEQLLIQKSFLEIGMYVLILIFYFLFGSGTWILLIIYPHFLRLKYILNQRHKKAWEQIDSKITNLMKQNNAPQFIVSGYKYILKILNIFVSFKKK